MATSVEVSFPLRCSAARSSTSASEVTWQSLERSGLAPGNPLQ